MNPLRTTFRGRFAVFATLTIGSLVLASAAVAPAAARGGAEKAEWKAPARAARKKNPVEADKASLEAGRKVYAAECADCHGPRGAGDGPGSRELKDPIPSLADSRLWAQSDGELFWKLSTGRGDMPGFDDMLEEEDRWHVLNYLRATFGAGAQRRDRDKDAQVASRRGNAE